MQSFTTFRQVKKVLHLRCLYECKHRIYFFADFLPVIWKSPDAPQSFPPSSFSPPSSFPRCPFDRGRCRRHCRNSPHLPNFSSCAYGRLEMRHEKRQFFDATIRTVWSRCFHHLESGMDVHTCFLAQQSSGFQHPTSFQTALDGCFLFFACMCDLGHQLPPKGIIHRKSDRRSSVKGVIPKTFNRNSLDFLLGHLLYPAQPAATTFVFILKL